MFGFRRLDVYQCAVTALPLYRIARGSPLECAAVLDALHALELVTREEVEPVEELLVRIVAMLTKMAAR